MKILKISEDEKSAFFYDCDSKTYKPLELLSKNDISKIVNYILKNEDTELDSYKDTIQNKAQNTIYNNLAPKLDSLIKDRESILDEINNLYKDAIDKYLKD